MRVFWFIGNLTIWLNDLGSGQSEDPVEPAQLMVLEEGLILHLIVRELLFCDLFDQLFVHGHIGVEDGEYRVVVERAKNCLHVDSLDIMVVLNALRNLGQLLQVDLSVRLEDAHADVSALSVLPIDVFAVHLALLCNHVEVLSPVVLDFHEEEAVSGLDLLHVDTLSHRDSWVYVLFWSDELPRRIQEVNLLRLWLS